MIYRVRVAEVMDGKGGRRILRLVFFLLITYNERSSDNEVKTTREWTRFLRHDKTVLLDE